MSHIRKRTDYCGELRDTDKGKSVVLNGWVSKKRNLGGLIFCDLRDRSGIVQVVFNDNLDKQIFETADSLKSEYVISVSGKVVERESKNSKLPTGDIEVIVDDFQIYSEADTPPIYVKDDDNVDENLRLKYRFLDLRKPKMQHNLMFRHKVAISTRNFLDQEGFIEVETPTLVKPTPEGARDYLIPSRMNSGKFYALPQSPQLFKQILMASGIDKYYQIAKCYRDEDLRADRQPEFTQIDMEMSFVQPDDIMDVQERFMKKLFKDVLDKDIEIPFRRISYDEAMERYGSDKPDTRFGFELVDLGEIVKDCDFKVFTGALESGGRVKAININAGADKFTRKEIDKLAEAVKSYGAKGLAWIKVAEDDITSPIAKFFDKAKISEILEVMEAKTGDLILIVADKASVVFDSLGFLRRHIAGRLGLLDDTVFDFIWVTDFPLFEYDKEEGRYTAMHHPFTQPKYEDIPLLDTEPGKVKAQAYDIVLNGVEIGGGSIRIHNGELQKKMFKALGISDDEAREKFGFLLEAFRYGTPPHGGLAYGLDRLVMIMLGESSIREVIAFPKNQNAQCLMSGAPGNIDEEQLKELSISVVSEE